MHFINFNFVKTDVHVLNLYLGRITVTVFCLNIISGSPLLGVVLAECFNRKRSQSIYLNVIIFS